MNGCDISSYQGTVDFDQLKTAADFVIVKSTEGSGFTDSQFGRNWREAKRVGLRRGAFHFARPDLGTNATVEADWFIDQVRGEGGFETGDMVALDYEVDWNGPVVAWCLAWLDRVKAQTDITPYIYLNLFLSHVYDWGAIEQPGGYPLWLADYDGQPDTIIETPWPRVAIKQWTSSGRIAGVSGDVDLNSMEDDVAFKDDPDAQAYIADVRNTFEAIKTVLSQLADGERADAAALARIAAAAQPK